MTQIIEKELYELFCYISDNDGKYHIKKAPNYIDHAKLFLELLDKSLNELEKEYVYTYLYEDKELILNHKNKQLELIKAVNKNVEENDIVYDAETEQVLEELNEAIPCYWNAENFKMPKRDELLELIHKKYR